MSIPDQSTERLQYFSDAIIAIAATLLAVELHPPRTEALDGTTLLLELQRLWPSYLAFALSFLFIGIAWAAHHDMFKYIRRADHVFLIINLLFLMSIAVHPFSTALLAEHLGKPTERTAALVYYSVSLSTSVSYNLVWQYAIWRGLVHANAKVLRALSIEHMVAPLLHLSALVTALWSVRFSFIPMFLLYTFYAMPRISEHWIEKAAKTAREVTEAIAPAAESQNPENAGVTNDQDPGAVFAGDSDHPAAHGPRRHAASSLQNRVT